MMREVPSAAMALGSPMTDRGGAPLRQNHGNDLGDALLRMSARLAVLAALLVVSMTLRAAEPKHGVPPLALPVPTSDLERNLQQDFQRAEAVHGTLSLELAPALNALLGHYRREETYQMIVALRTRWTAIVEAERGPRHAQTLRAKLDLAGLLVALRQYELAQPILDALVEGFDKAEAPDPKMHEEALGRRSVMHWGRGQNTLALEDRERSLAIRGALEAPTADDLVDLAFSRLHAGQLARGLSDLDRAIAQLEGGPPTDQLQRAKFLQAWAMLELGAVDKSEKLAREVLELGERTGTRGAARRKYLASQLLVEIELGRGNHDRALEQSRSVLALAETQKPPDPGAVSSAMTLMGVILVQLGRGEEAAALIDRATQTKRELYPPPSGRLASGLLAQSRVAELRGDSEAARRRADEAYLAMVGVDDPLWASSVAARVSKLAMDRGDLALAIFFGKQAVNNLQQVRSSLVERSAEERALFVTSNAQTYRQLADALVAQGRIPESQQALKLLKDEEYREYLRGESRSSDDPAGVDFVGKEHQAAARQDRMREQVMRLGKELGDLERMSRVGLTDAQRSRRTQLESQMVSARREFEAFLAGLNTELAATGAERNREVGGRQLERLGALRRTLRELGDGVVLLHYLVTSNRVAIILTTPSAQLARDSAVTSARLNQSVAAFRTALQSPMRDATVPGKVLYDILVRPIEKDLEDAGARVLMLSLDGALRYVPFAALHDGKRYLAQRYQTVLYSEAARDKLKDRPRAEWRMAGLGVTKEKPGFSPLPSVRDELEGIQGSVLPGEIWLDEEFTAERMQASLDKGYPVLHIASHFAFRPGTEADSFLLLGDGSRLSLKMIRERNLDFGGVDLMTLSACDTASGGGRDEDGREVEGFATLVQNLGAKGVVATLWPVADESTGTFMRDMYRFRQGSPPGTKADALRKTQLKFLNDARLSHPFFWAPFVLMGNWL